jgi:exonuclease III
MPPPVQKCRLVGRSSSTISGEDCLKFGDHQLAQPRRRDDLDRIVPGEQAPRQFGVAILARGADPVESRRGLSGDPDDTHSRYIEASVDGLLIGCLYLPNGNPAPGPTTGCAGLTG